MKDTSWAVLIIGAVLLFALVSPSIINAGTNFLGGLKDFIQSGFNEFGEGRSTANLGLQIHYTDGSIKTFEPNPYSMLPLTIQDGGGAVSKITVTLVVRMEHEGIVSQWSCDSLLVANIRQGSELKVGQFKYWQVQAQGTAWATVGRDIAKKEITAQEIESATKGYGEGTYILQLIFDLTFTATFTDGTTEHKGATAVPATWTYDYTTDDPTEPAGAIKSLSVQIGIARLRP